MQGRGPGGPLGTLSHSCPETHLSVGHRHTEASLAQVVGWEVGKQFAESQCFRQGASGNNNRITTRYHCHGHEKRESNAYRLSGKGRKVQARKTKVAKTQTPRQTGGGRSVTGGNPALPRDREGAIVRTPPGDRGVGAAPCPPPHLHGRGHTDPTVHTGKRGPGRPPLPRAPHRELPRTRSLPHRQRARPRADYPRATKTKAHREP